MRTRFLVTTIAMLIVVGCSRGSGDSPPQTALPSDTVRGTPAVVGSERDMRVTLRPVIGGASIRLTGPQADLVGHAAGADVWVEGRRTGSDEMAVERFEVRSADGVPALDGTLVQEGSSYFLITASGVRHSVARVPSALRAHVGDRVWISGDLDRLSAFGVIEDRN